MEAYYLNSKPKGNTKEKEKKKMLVAGKSNCYFGMEKNL